MRWTPTHRITYSPNREEPEAFEVMAFDLGCDHPGPGRYGLFTQDEWDAGAPPDWTMDLEGQVWYQGAAAPGEGPATIQDLWNG